ncbi:CDP-alcohol phosphatidyltransferase family protein, partial [Vibrio campbellii]|uniref:CDP-alcohol phosphatidyltransferase family protein n=2 Tax=Vibrio TaxID=662 RepID=UPI003D0FD4D6
MEKPIRKKFRQETVIHSFIVRPLAQEIVLLLWNTNITANQITFFRVILNAIALIMFAYGSAISVCLGVILFQCHEVIDHADGEYARAKKQSSRVGQYYETVFDNLLSSSFGLFGLSIAIGAFNYSGNALYLVFFLLTAITASMYFVLYGEISKSLESSSFAAVEHDKEEMLALWGVPLKVAVKNLFRTVIKWHNQLLLFGIILLYTLGINWFLLLSSAL